ncbi:peptidoglycan editing factor PgeF [Magnetospira thiophila]
MILTVASLNAVSRVRHAFFTRQGGLSEGIYASLNCGPGSRDDSKRVMANRARAMQWIDRPADALVTVHQVHSARVVAVDGPWTGDPPEADAMVTSQVGVVLGILTADCAPVLLADGQARVVAAAHAGWRGAVDGVIGATVKAMVERGAKPSNIVAAVGPCIQQRSYEVGPDMVEALLSIDKHNENYLLPSRKPGHHMFDLAACVMMRLQRAGLRNIIGTPCDTYAEPDRFFSYRRTTHKGEPDYGRQLSAIYLEP